MDTALKHTWMKIGVIAVAAIGLAVLFSRILAPGWDLYGLFYPAIQAAWQGQFSYAKLTLFTNPPWALVLLMPLGWLPPALAHGVLVVATLIAMWWVMRDYRRFKVSYPLAVLSLPMLALVWVGQLEVFALVGTMVAYRAALRRNPWLMALGLVLLTIKPQETFLIILLLLSGSIRRWSKSDWIKMGGLFIAVALMTSSLFGFGWLARMLNGPVYASGWQNFSVWQLGESVPRIIVIGLWLLIAIGTAWALRRAGLSRLGLAIAAVGSNLLSPYLTAPHLLMTMCFSWGLLFDRSLKWGVVAYLASLTPLSRLATGNQALNRLDVIFPLMVLGGLCVQILVEHSSREQPPLLKEVT